MSLSPETAARLEVALSDSLGEPVSLQGFQRVGGGCIHNALALETSAGRFFAKLNEGEAGAAFTIEARGLEALRKASDKAGLIQVPRVVHAHDAQGHDQGWLVLEYLPPSPPASGYDEALGRGLRALHSAGDDDRGFGWSETNRIGSLPQENPWRDDWSGFWREARLRPQFEAALHEGGLTRTDEGWIHPLLDAVESALDSVPVDGPELVHGDLWSGNVHPGPDGRPVLVDPAVYLGHGEVDLAMAELFGGFSRATFQAYGPLPPGYPEVRRPLYQLYYLLVHVRLFGRSYYAGTRRAAEMVVANVSG